MMPVSAGLGGERERLALGVHHRDQLVVADLDEALGGADLDLLALDRGRVCMTSPMAFSLTCCEEALDDVELDVGFEQRQAHVAQRRSMFSSVSSVRPDRRWRAARKPLVSVSNMRPLAPGRRARYGRERKRMGPKPPKKRESPGGGLAWGASASQPGQARQSPC